MKRYMAVILALVIILAGVGVGPVYAGGRGGHSGGHSGGFHGGHGHFHGHGRFFVGVGPVFLGPWYPYWYPPYPVYPVAPVVVQDPPVYIQQSPGSGGTWYYCMSLRAYYPSVPSCPDPWVPVPARPY